MMLSRTLRVVVLSSLLCSFAMPSIMAQTATKQTQESPIALQRGYRTGYSDGYMAGYRDTIDSLARNYSRHAEYTKADRAYNKDYGSMEDYRDGYQQGFESGYETGYDRRSFEASLPTGLKRRGVMVGDRQNMATTTVVNTDQTTNGNISDSDRVEQNSNVNESNTTTGYQSNGNAIIFIPRDTDLLVELQDDLSTDKNREGDKFTAKVVSPSEIAGATVEGRVSKVRHAGKLNRHSELVLSFDRIILTDTRWSNINASLTEVVAVKGDNVQRVDNEGTAIGKSSLKSDAIKVGAAAGAGLVVGAIVGGPVGAAVGAGVGAAFGVGAVVIQRGKQIKLNRNQQLRIKTAYETQIR